MDNDDFSGISPRENLLYLLVEMEQAVKRGAAVPAAEINQAQRRLILLAELIGWSARRH